MKIQGDFGIIGKKGRSNKNKYKLGIGGILIFVSKNQICIFAKNIMSEILLK